MYRLLYCKYGGLKEYNAVFSDDCMFLRTLLYTSAFFTLTGSLPIVIAAVFGLANI
jgi:ABC-type sugar transport system permease subunit